tara:strand:- start:19566 stop:20222 length:657 start_codon:yes stop_codon:yes gene_type:complete
MAINITDITYFKNDLYIPLAKAIVTTSPSQGSPNNTNWINNNIDVLERRLLLNALQLDSYNELQLALVDLPMAGQKWIDLVEGVEYDGKVWEGLKNENSLIANFIYYHCLSKSESGFNNAMGVSKPKAENAEHFDPTIKLSQSWNTFLYKYQNYLGSELKLSYIGNNEFIDEVNDTIDVEVSLFTFLYDHKEDYNFDYLKFRQYKRKQTQGIWVNTQY